jgi:hypothetical protein
MRRWFAGQDEGAAHLTDGLDDRLTGEKIGRPAEGAPLPDLAGPASVWRHCVHNLLLRAVMGRDELGWQRQNAGVARRYHGSAQKGVEVFGAAVRTPPGRAALAVDLARTEVFRSVQRDQHPASEALKRREYALDLDSFKEQRMSAAGEAPSSIRRI